jgi:hypothetical protein
VPTLSLGVAPEEEGSGRVSGLPVETLEKWGEATMTRVKLSLRLGIVGGIIWGLIFTAYYAMLPYMTISQEKRFTFAWESASICFITLVIFILALPYIYKEIKGAKQ